MSTAKDPTSSETRDLLRRSFYAALSRPVPRSPKHLPSYIRAVQRRYGLTSRNQARAMLAQVEGYTSWRELMLNAE